MHPVLSSLRFIDYIFHCFPRLSRVTWPPQSRNHQDRPARGFRCARETSHGVSSSPIGYPQAPHLNSLPTCRGAAAASKQAAGSGGQPSVGKNFLAKIVRTPGRSPHVSGSLAQGAALGPHVVAPNQSRLLAACDLACSPSSSPAQWVFFIHTDGYDAVGYVL